MATHILTVTEPEIKLIQATYHAQIVARELNELCQVKYCFLRIGHCPAWVEDEIKMLKAINNIQQAKKNKAKNNLARA
jgi:hypothetical protein